MVKDRKFKVEDVFEYKGHECVIRSHLGPATIPLEGNERDPKLLAEKIKGERKRHNGYVKLGDPEEVDQGEANLQKSQINTCEITFLDKMENLKDAQGKVKGLFWGFDTNHIYNLKSPETREKDSVKEKTKRLVDEMEDKNIFSEIRKG